MRLPGRQPRRLCDTVLVAFHQACDATDLETAARMLSALETMLTRQPWPPVDRRRQLDQECLVAAHERLWDLRQRGNEGEN